MLANTIIVDDYSKPIEDFWDKVQFGGTMLLIGLATVFAVLIILWLALLLFKFAFHDLPAKRKANSTSKTEVPVQTEAPVVSNDGEIIAVIAAAIAMAESDSDGVKFRVVSFRRR